MEFVDRSGITISSLTEVQAEHVAVLGQVWGYLKYHHPKVTSGELHWDFELFRVLPRVLEAANREDLNLILEQWVDRLGVPADCDPCAASPQDVHLLPRLGWIDDVEMLGSALSGQLKAIHARRPSGGEQFYVSQAPGVGNPVFNQELGYRNQQPPDVGFRILALIRYWNVIEYWFPYRDQIEGDWYKTLREFMPRLVAADTWDAYRLYLLGLFARIQFSHAILNPFLDVKPHLGFCSWQMVVRFIDGRPTVTALKVESQEKDFFAIGDIIETVDGEPIGSLVRKWSPYYSASNETIRLRDIARSLPRGECGVSMVTVKRLNDEKTLKVPRVANPDPRPFTHDRPGETFQLLSADVGYLKLSSIRIQDMDGYFERASGTRGLIIDIRNYPSVFVVFALGSRLVQEPTPFVRFTIGDLENPSAFSWTQPIALQPGGSDYKGVVVILVDEVSISQAEYTAMALRAGPRAVVVGSTTAGADGNVSTFPLPGGLRTSMSGIGVFYPDKTVTQQVGIVPNIEVSPTLVGIREGRDEVLEAAVRYILGSH